MVVNSFLIIPVAVTVKVIEVKGEVLHCSYVSVNTKITFQQKVSVKLGHWGVTNVNLCTLSHFTASLAV